MKITLAIAIVALLVASVIADGPPSYTWTAVFKGDKCDWSQASYVIAEQSIIACAEVSCSSAGGFSTMIHCGTDFPAAKASPSGSLIVTFTQGNCAGNAVSKVWSSDAGCNEGTSHTCAGNSVTTNTFSNKDCTGTPTASVSYGTGCTSAGGVSVGYYCGRDASPASTLVASALVAVVALVLAL